MLRKVARIPVAMLLALVPVLAVVSSAAAVPPSAVHIEVPELIGVNGDPFTATGEAVDAGVLCANGTVDDLSVAVMGAPGAPYRTILAHKRFYCGDASGTFDLKLTVRLDTATLHTTARWRAAGGTGAYVGLRGSGRLTGTPIVPNVSVYDVYDGNVH